MKNSKRFDISLNFSLEDMNESDKFKQAIVDALIGVAEVYEADVDFSLDVYRDH